MKIEVRVNGEYGRLIKMIGFQLAPLDVKQGDFIRVNINNLHKVSKVVYDLSKPPHVKKVIVGEPTK